MPTARESLPVRFIKQALLLTALLAASALTGLTAAEDRDSPGSPSASKPDPAAVEFFEKHVRPVLVARCFECHAGSEPKGGLRLDSRETILAGGDSGPAVDLDEPEASLLVEAIRYEPDGLIQMPPTGRLKEPEIAALVKWVQMGVPWPDSRLRLSRPAYEKSASNSLSQQTTHWAFLPPRDPSLPEVSNVHWPKSPLDYFVLAKLEKAGLSPASPADKRTLIRRATYSLIGLPPTPEEIESFLNDESPDAFAKVVDRLLASPHYGERWGRHWLDVARYADSNGVDENLAYANAFRYRDYVVAAFNNDKPYDQFVREQIAGDLLKDDPRFESRVATGFLSLGPKMLACDDPVKMQMDIVDEQIDTIGRTFMGLTLGCARCHDHKFDPISAEDYYALAGIFKSTKTMQNFKVVAKWFEWPLASEEEINRRRRLLGKIEQTKAEIERVKKSASSQVRFFLGYSPTRQLGNFLRRQWCLNELREDLASLEDELPEFAYAMGVSEGEPQDIPVHVRGSHLNLGDVVPRRFPEVFETGGTTTIDPNQSGRLQLAEWITRSEHPLTGRVMANRIWRWHFGTGLVRTPDNFGTMAEPPVNQPLLDWLALRFIESGWSIKAMHRLILLSATYQMSSDYNEQAAGVDPENKLLWRMPPQRLEAEAIRDAILAVSGSLDPRMGGSILTTKNREYVTNTGNKNYNGYDSRKRSLYLPVVRSALYEMFEVFDFAEPSTLNGDRATTTVAPQSLFMMNSEVVANAARQMAVGLLADERLDDADRVRQAYERAYGRPATEHEVGRALDFVLRFEHALEKTKVEAGSASNRSLCRTRAWQSLCRAIFASSEFIHVN